MSEIDDLRAELARMRERVEHLERSTAEPPRRGPEAVPADGPIDRRAALRKAGMMAAGAMAGGAAITAITASPAAAATITGSGSPGVVAAGLSGDGLSASTDAPTKSAVYATTAVTTAFGAFARHTGGGTAIAARSTSGPGEAATLDVENAGSGPALRVVSAGGTGLASTFSGATVMTGSAPLFIEKTAAGSAGIDVDGNGGGTGVYVHGATVGLGVATTLDHLRLQPLVGTEPPLRSTAASLGAVTQLGADLWHCVGSGTPGTWRKVSGGATAGALHVLTAPHRVYDSRPGTAPTSVGPKTKLAPNAARTIDLKYAGEVPAGATAALLTILLVNAAAGAGNVTVWANGVAKPLANTMVWGGNAGRFTATAVTGLDAQARIQVSASLATDIVVDVVGFYR